MEILECSRLLGLLSFYRNPITLFTAADRKILSEIPFQKLSTTEQLEEFDKIIYWGDFTHWRRYGVNDWKGKLDDWYNFFLLEKRPDLHSRVIAFGHTLYDLSARDLSDLRYRSALTSLYEKSQLVLPRDILSSSFVEMIAPKHSHPTGCDCAFLLDSSRDLQVSSSNIDCVAVAFGRSGEREQQLDFSQKLAERLNLPLVEVNWFQEIGVENLKKHLSIFRGARVVVTDFYHVGINAWREGAPTFTIARAKSYASSSVDDKKKEIFARQTLSTEFLLYLEDVFHLQEKTLDYVVQVLEHPALYKTAIDVMSFQSARAMNRLRHFLDK